MSITIGEILLSFATTLYQISIIFAGVSLALLLAAKHISFSLQPLIINNIDCFCGEELEEECEGCPMKEEGTCCKDKDSK